MFPNGFGGEEFVIDAVKVTGPNALAVAEISSTSRWNEPT
jgi:hypothetical protein